MPFAQVQIPESVLLATGQSKEELVHEAMLLLALKLFEQGRISSAQAAAICEIGRVDFLWTAGHRGVPVASLESDELDREFQD